MQSFSEKNATETVAGIEQHLTCRTVVDGWCESHSLRLRPTDAREEQAIHFPARESLDGEDPNV